MYYYDYIQHAGTKGMKWGQRLYQNKDGSLTPLGRVRYSTSKKYKTTVDRERALKKAREAKEEKKHHEENRQKAMKSGSASDVMKFKGEFTKAEREEIKSRLDWERSMNDISDREAASGKTKTDKLMDKVGKATDYGIKGLKAYNLLANIYNGVKGDHILPKIDTNITNDNIENRKKSNEEKQKSKRKFNLEEFMKDINNKTDKEVQDAQQRVANEKKLRDEMNRRKKDAEKKNNSSQTDKKAEKEAAEQAKKTEKSDNNKTETWEGTVEGTGTSKGSQSKSTTKTKSSDYYDPIDGQGEWVNESVSNLPAVYRSSGQSRVNRYLEDYGGMLLEDFPRR